MKITAITAQQKNPNRVNVMVEGKYRFSLDIFQVVDLKLKIGNDYSEEELVELETESQFGKLYGRALEYSLSRPHSAREIRDYLYRKTRDTPTKTGDMRKGVSQVVAERVYERLLEKGHIDDVAFARFWVENRNMRKGSSRRKLTAELQAKGVDRAVIEQALGETERSDDEEIMKIIAKKRPRYSDEQKFKQYLARQGFSFDAITEALQRDSER